MSELHDQELEAFEAELRKVKAAPVPEALSSRLLAIRLPPGPAAVDRVRSETGGRLPWQGNPTWGPAWIRLLRWLVPATALGVFLVITLGKHQPPSGARTGTNSQQAKVSSAALSVRVKPEEIEIGRTLVATFDAVAELPSGEPVRFRCQQWADTTMFRDRARGIDIEQSTPRLEIVPVSLDTY
jgi:hypothetical protein